MDGLAARLGFFGLALLAAPLVVALLHETVFESIWLIGLPVLATIVAGALMRRAFWELVLGALLSAGVAYLTVIVWILAACSGKTDCI